MIQELFNIKSQGYHNTKGIKIDTFAIILVRIINFRAFSTTLEAYIEKRNEKNEPLEPGYNVTIPTPENWDTDDMVAIKAFAAHERVDCEVIDTWTPPVIENVEVNNNA